MRLETERLILVPLAEEHFDLYWELDRDPEIMKFIRKHSETVEEARNHFQKSMFYDSQNPGLGLFAVTEKVTKEYVGIGVLVHIERNRDNGIEVGYRLLKNAWGKGYATEIAKRLIQYGFDELKLKEIFGTTKPDHVVSQKALMKAGLEKIGSGPFYDGCTMFRIKPN